MKFSGSRGRRVIEVSVTITTRKVSPHEETHFSRDSVLKKGRNTTGEGGRGREADGKRRRKIPRPRSSSRRARGNISAEFAQEAKKETGRGRGRRRGEK